MLGDSLTKDLKQLFNTQVAEPVPRLVSQQVNDLQRGRLETQPSRTEEQNIVLNSSIRRELQDELQAYLYRDSWSRKHSVLAETIPMREQLSALRSPFANAGPSRSPPVYGRQEEVILLRKGAPSSQSNSRSPRGESKTHPVSISSSDSDTSTSSREGVELTRNLTDTNHANRGFKRALSYKTYRLNKRNENESSRVSKKVHSTIQRFDGLDPLSILKFFVKLKLEASKNDA